MTASALLEQLQVLVTGVDAAIARDVVRLLVEEGASVVAADPDAAKLARLARDVGLCHPRFETAVVDLADAGEVRTWETRLRRFGRAPELIVCCCGSPACAGGAARRARPSPAVRDVALGERSSAGCRADAAAHILQPTLFLHAEPLRRSVFDRAISVLRHPTLRGLIERVPVLAGLGPASPYAQGQSRTASLDGAGRSRPRLRLVSPSDASPERADAA
jgi:NAD(P)-dependent dehydrogenase (short-subunit alcohol dehydrogenase family)